MQIRFYVTMWIVSYMSDRQEERPSEQDEILKIASCLGRQFQY